ncbi:myocardin-related transcription factor A [Polypterus senegalus]|uniref:myocardin-related transcription factor A n=1 Tax=Polypterus senegalus TaxID=55291 RepID=UPI001962B4BC|nr:myocardin-related transcription factor A [Polypterus senegalus]XP_039597426.1 myocardin-related transcription factor A [Polypterus senegalus]
MTLLASERSILIRNKFRSVLQLRMQHRQQQGEPVTDPALMKTNSGFTGERDGEKGRTDDLLRHKVAQRLPQPDSTHKAPADDPGELRQKKARLAEDLSEKILKRPGPLELVQKNILPLGSNELSEAVTARIQLPQMSTESFDDEISSSPASSPEQPLGFASSPDQSADQPMRSISPVSTSSSATSPTFQCSLTLLPLTEISSQPIPMSVAEADPIATSGMTSGIFLPVQPVPLLSKVKPPRPKKPKESKPKVRRLKYHQYVPPDQKSSSEAGNASGNSQTATTLVMDPAYSRLLQQQQVFLQLQILQQQQQGGTTQQLCVQGIGNSGDQVLGFTSSSSTVSPPSVKVKPKCSASPPGSTHKPELLPSNLDDLTVSELRQQLRKRGLPVSGTKPALLERLKPYQIQRPCAPPAPLRGAPILVPSATLTSPIDPTQSGASTFITPADGSVPVNSTFLVKTNLKATGGQFSAPSGTAVTSAFLNQENPFPAGGATVFVKPEGGFLSSSSSTPLGGQFLGHTDRGPFLTPASDTGQSATPTATAAPPESSSREEVRIPQERKLPECSVPSWDIPVDWRRAEDMRVELEMQQRLKNRHRERGASLGPPQHRLPATATGAAQHVQLEFQPGDGEKSPQGSPVLSVPPTSCAFSPPVSPPLALQTTESGLHPFLQRDNSTGGRGNCGPAGEQQTEHYATQVFCSQPCEPIGQDFELPMEITASPPQPLPAARTLEEELQEAIQRVQMAPSQSIDDILDEPLSCSDSSLAEHEASQLTTAPLLAHSPPPSQPALQEDANFLTEPLCPSLSLELPDSPPPPMVSPPSASSVMDILSSHKGSQEAMTFDPADWLEALTFGFRPNSPPVPPFVSTDFGLDSDISTMRVLDLIIEQW